MPTADTFVQEMEEKNRLSFQRLTGAYGEALTKEAFSPADLLRLEQRSLVEAIEVAAIWIVENPELPAKLEHATEAGENALVFSRLSDRLLALGIEPGAFDPRFGGYTKLFAFYRSLQAPEERAAGSAVTLGTMSMLRYEILARATASDPETARIFSDSLPQTPRRRLDEGRQTLLRHATTEESQARARRAAFRTIELLGENLDGAFMRRFLSRSLKKPTSAI